MSDREIYTVGWICALQTEYVAARCFLDEDHGKPGSVNSNDHNHYTLGKIGGHNVAIAVLPSGKYGISSATAVVKDMLHSFPNIRIGFMVGIGGGAPSRKHDIRLGDVVVSAPRDDGNGGVYQYDFGKTIQNQSFQHTGFLNQPPLVLLTAVTGLAAQYETDGHQFEKAISDILDKKPRLRKKYKRPDPSSDKLYRSEIIHPPKEGSCATTCGDDLSKQELRSERTEEEDNPAVHYGLIASANQLMKDASIRDRLAAEKNVLCFEMEAAGLVDQFPCLVIRGICDYSDSHKNNEWQGYAAMAAAAYAKDLLCEMVPAKVEAEKKIVEIPGILSSNPSTNFNKALEQCHEGSGRWFLESNEFAEWKVQQSSFLWLHGIPGCGKTILSSTIIQKLESDLDCQPLLYFYFDFTDAGKQTFENMLRALTNQLYHKHEGSSQQLESLYSSCKTQHRQPTSRSLCETFLQMVTQVKEVWLVLDALDECRKEERRDLVRWMEKVLKSEQGNVHLLVTSRQESDIETGIMKFAHKNDIIPIRERLVANDIRAYIHTRVKKDTGFKRWRSRPEVQSEIEEKLAQKANGM
ncbi:hypothetical protein ABW20_dc0108227 [Dactylellina cionopaga]|nr:hypothetical protein ABW20_dc0108227 [Dactylellina cionopaga]